MPDPTPLFSLAEIAAGEQVEAAATPGPLIVLAPDKDTEKWMISRRPGCGDVPPEKFYLAPVLSVGSRWRDKADAMLFAQARNDYRRLLALARWANNAQVFILDIFKNYECGNRIDGKAERLLAQVRAPAPTPTEEI